MTDVVLALTTWPDDMDAAATAQDLVSQGVAACVTILPAVQSVYSWEGGIEVVQERQLVIKTTRAKVDALWTALRACHPYDVPEFIVLPVLEGNPAYLEWIARVTG